MFCNKSIVVVFRHKLLVRTTVLPTYYENGHIMNIHPNDSTIESAKKSSFDPLPNRRAKKTVEQEVNATSKKIHILLKNMYARHFKDQYV